MVGKPTSLWLRPYHLRASIHRKIYSECMTFTDLRREYDRARFMVSFSATGVLFS